ncbi:uncharacterized protein LOC132196369 [Neocloeon triangulifer]|uniref:uncharacterized protein LOC132196369 n=1 Tax=Neocloeon triangulifer TaxID=2078957 RepID=UPI00286F3FD1|nr:uncharacterized protein LOC132196369 [Neocloeon triangulifer]XP_059474934.1 uncharacterized protein LOC132196369 [Neocloeon triangulifer]
MASKPTERKKKKQKNVMEAKFIRTKPLPPPQPTQQSSQTSSSQNQNKSNKSEKKNSTEIKEQKDQLKEQYWAKLLASGFCKDNLRPTDPKSNFSEADWMEVRQYFNHAYHATNEDSKQFVKKNASKIVKVIKRLCAKDSQQVLLFLESQVQEYVIEVKVKLLELLKKAGQPSQVARNFLTKLVDHYASLSSGATCLSEALKDLEEQHLAMFGMGWEDLNRLLFERCVHSDPVVQLKIPQFVSQLQGCLNQKDKGGFYGVFQRLLTLEEHMTGISEKWKRVEGLVHEKNVSNLSKMVSQLRIDLCDNKGTKKQCSCSICSSLLLKQLSQLGLAQQNTKGPPPQQKVKEQKSVESKSTAKQTQANVKNNTQDKKQSKQQPKGGKEKKGEKVDVQTGKGKEAATKGKGKQAPPPPPPVVSEPGKKTKQKNSSTSSEKSLSTPEHKVIPQSKKETKVKEKNPGDNRSLHDLLEFIEGTDSASKDEKKAAKKARQKMKKLQDGQVEKKVAKPEPPAAVIKVPKQASSIQIAPKADGKKEPQMVTIRRVMEPSSSEPTVTITLKGDTPDHDKVLFTLVNGQVKDDAKGKGKQAEQKPAPETKKSKKKKGAKQAEPAPVPPPAPQPLAQSYVLSQQQMQQERFMVSSNPYQPVPKPHVTVTPIMGPPYTARAPAQEMSVSDFCAQQPKLGPFRAPIVPTRGFQEDPLQQNQHDGQFSLHNIKLPPGITITKVEGPRIARVEPPPPPVRKEEQGGYQQVGTMIVNMPQPLPPSSYQQHNLNAAQMGSMRNMGMQNPNVIVVDTGKLMDEEAPAHNYANNHNGLWQQTNGTLKHPHLAGGGVMLNGNVIPNGQVPQGTAGGKKKKKKGKKGEEWNLVESVFTPKDIDLDAVDDDERELEAFKRFCFNSVPPEHKEKVHLNLKDLVIKKKP